MPWISVALSRIGVQTHACRTEEGGRGAGQEQEATIEMEWLALAVFSEHKDEWSSDFRASTQFQLDHLHEVFLTQPTRLLLGEGQRSIMKGLRQMTPGESLP